MASSLSADDLAALATYYQTHPLPQRFNAGVVVASIVASFLGCETTLLLLSRRTSTAGARNWGILVLAATTMSSVGIWGMHFIGMNITLNPTPGIDWYIQFSPGFTLLSLFVPMFSLVFTFVFIGAGPESLPADDREDGCERPSETHYPDGASFVSRTLWSCTSCLRRRTSEELLSLRIVVGGLIVGGTVALMHYSAGFSSSFERNYNPAHLIFSIVLACVASTLSLLVFFRFHSQWHANWWKQMVCALGLAIGVSGMHYLGITGTHWYVPSGKTEGFKEGKRTSNVLTLAISVMCFGVCVISFIIVLSDFLVTRESRRKARRVTIASATFDKAGRVLVNLDGMLPMSEVETDFPLKEIFEELNYRQPTFQWLYSLSWDWSILDPLLPEIASRALGLTSVTPTTLSGGMFRSRKEPGSSYTSSKNAAQLAVFKDRCLDSTQTLANSMGLPVNQMGVFFDNTLRTGTASTPSFQEKNSRLNLNDEESSTYNAAIHSSREGGVMLFLVRELSGENQDTMDNYLKRGYRFSDTRWFAPVLADRAAVAKVQIDGLLNQLKLFAKRGTKPCVRSGGIYVGFFAIRPSISRQGGIDTLVYQFARHQIPAYRLPDVDGITDDMRSWIGAMAGHRLRDLSEMCTKETGTNLPPPASRNAEELWIFKSSLSLAMDAMAANLKMFPDLPERSVLSAEIIDVPSSNDDSTKTASMIVFQATFPAPTRHGDELPGLCIQNETAGAYQQPEPVPTFVFVPYTLFSKTQMMMLRGNQARKFTRDCRFELSKRLASHRGATKSILQPTGEHPEFSSPAEKYPLPASPKNQWQDLKNKNEFSEVEAVEVKDDIHELPSQAQIGQTRQNHLDCDSATPQVVVKGILGTPQRKQGSPQNWRSPEYDGSLAPAYSPPPTGSSEGNVFNPLLAPPLVVRADGTEAAKTRAQPLVVTARLRSDDWHTRCLHGLEQSEAGQALIGVDW